MKLLIRILKDIFKNLSMLFRKKSQYELKKEARIIQCNSFEVSDMQKFPDIPISWCYVEKLFHTNGIAWCQLNLNNQYIVLQYISQINDIIKDSTNYIDGIDGSNIDLNSINFDYPIYPFCGNMCCSRIECYPYTPTGKLSKYPIIIHFETKPNDSGTIIIGEIKVLQDGNIGSANISMNGNVFKIGLHGTSLVLKRVDNSYLGGNLFKFSEIYD